MKRPKHNNSITLSRIQRYVPEPKSDHRLPKIFEWAIIITLAAAILFWVIIPTIGSVVGAILWP